MEAKGFIKRVEEVENSNSKNSLKLVVVQKDIMLGGEIEYRVQLLNSETDGKSDYSKDKIDKIFNHLSKQGVELETPDKLNMENLQKEFQQYIGTEIIFYIIPHSYDDGHGGIRPVDIYSLYEYYEPVQYSNANVSEILKTFPQLRNKPFNARFVGFNSYRNNVFFDMSNERNEAEILKRTYTRKGLAEHIYRTLEKDNHNSGYAKQLMSNITEYVNRVGDNITTSGILKQVGIFSFETYNAKLLEEKTVKKLIALVSNTGRNGRANISTAQMLFSLDEMQGNKIFKTVNMYEKPYPVNGIESFCVTYNPDDTFIGEFANFYKPLMAIGCFSNEDVERLRTLKDGNEILNIFSEIIIRENLTPLVRLSVMNYSTRDVVTATLINFEKGRFVKRPEPLQQESSEKNKRFNEKPRSEESNQPKFFNYSGEKNKGVANEISEQDLPF